MNFREDLMDKFSSKQFNIMATLGFVGCMVLEASVWLMLFSVFVENIQFASNSYLYDLPVVGGLFKSLPDTNASHLISALMALFCVATPICLWSDIIDQKIMSNFQAWVQYPQHKFYLAFGVILAALCILIEALNLYEIISKQAAEPILIQTAEEADLQKWLAENKGMAVAASLILTIVNFILALISVKAFHALKSEE